jgi:hypothetical protein
MAFARTTAVSGAGTLTCAGNTTVTIAGSSFAFGIGAAPSTSTVRVGSTITVGANTRTVISIQSSSSLTVDTAFPAFTSQAYTVSTGIIQTGIDTLNNATATPTGFILREDRGSLFRIFDVQGLDLFIQGTLTVQSWGAQLRNDGSCSNRFQVEGSVSGGEIIFSGRKATANNGYFPYVGFDWLGNNGNKIMKLASTNATYPAKFTVIDAAVRFGADWLTTDSGNHSRISTSGDECWILCARGTGTGQARIRQDNTTATIDFQATQTWVGLWLNFGVPQLSLKGYTPIDTDGPEINLASVPTATRISIENYNTTYVIPNYYAGAQIVLLGGAWTRLKNNLRGTNIVWMSSSASGRNVLEFSKQITIKAQDTAGNLLSDGYMYYQPVGSNVAGIRAKGGTADITFDLTQQSILTVAGSATAEFPFAWGFTNANGNQSVYNYFCSGTTKGAETHSVGSSRYGFDKVYLTTALSGNNDVTPTYVHTSLPTSDKVIATAAAISGIAFNFTTKVMTITGNLNYQQIYDAYQYALNQTANLFQADNCLTANSTSDYVGWTINVGTGVTVSAGTGNFTTLKANTITLTGTAKILGNYTTSVGQSTTWTFSTVEAGSSIVIYDNAGVTKYFQAVTTAGDYSYYIAPQATGEAYTFAVEKYGYKREQGSFMSNAGGSIGYVPDYAEDIGIDVTNQATVSGYTILTTLNQVYDVTALFRLSEAGIKLGQLCTRDGLYLDFGTNNVKFDNDNPTVISYVGETITYKGLTIDATSKYTSAKAAPPATIIPVDNEQLNFVIEDANGDSQLSISGGDNLGYKLWKVPSSAPVDVDPTTGTLLATLATNEEVYRFIGVSGFDIIGVDLSSGVKRRSSMAKGVYTQSFYVGAQIQLDSQALPLLSLIDKIEALQLKVDTDLDVAVSTRLADADYIDPATPQTVWEYATRTLTSAGSSGATLAEIEGSLILAMKADVQAVEAKVDTKPTLAEMEAETTNLAKEDRLVVMQNTMDSFAGNDFDGMTDSLDAISTKVDGIDINLEVINRNVQDASLLIPASEELT